MTMMADAPDVVEVSQEDGRAILDRRARRDLHISLDEFLDRLERGEYQGSRDRAVRQLIMMLPLAV